MLKSPSRAFIAFFSAISLFTVSALSQAQNQNTKFLPPILFLLLDAEEQVTELLFDTPTEGTNITIPSGINFIRTTELQHSRLRQEVNSK